MGKARPNYLEVLDNAIDKARELLEADPLSHWQSLIVNRRKPHTYRIYTRWNNFRICLHRFHPCTSEEAFYHPHPWPGAFRILEGVYQMHIAYSHNREAPPAADACILKLPAGASYEIWNPLAWHKVVPLGEDPVYTIMVNDEPFRPECAHTQIRTTAGKDLDRMSEEEMLEAFDKFKTLLNK